MARRYAAEHPGVLNVDIDLIVGTLDGWRDDFGAALAVAREVGAANAIAHLQGGGDVVLPQLITSFDASPWADEWAARAGAEYIEFALLASRDEHRRRLREKRPDGDVDTWVQETVTGSDAGLLEKIVADLDDYLAGRPDTIRIDTGAQTPEETYAVLLEVLGT